jgi:hypothetical protein
MVHWLTDAPGICCIFFGSSHALRIDATIPTADDKRLAQIQEVGDGIAERLWPLGGHDEGEYSIHTTAQESAL